MSAFDLDRVFELMARFDKSKLSVLDLQLGGDRLRLESQATSATAATSADAAQALPVIEKNLQPTPALQPPPGATVQRSTIIGTFYRAPDPQASPFVEVGDRVRRGQIVCIVEAMKLMNEIEAERDGIVLEIPAVNGEPIGYDEPLLVIGPAEPVTSPSGAAGAARSDDAPTS